MRTFTGYRHGDISATHDANQVNPPNEPQFEGIVFSSGKTVINWCTAVSSTSVFDSFAEFMAIHGHPEPEYGSQIVWAE